MRRIICIERHPAGPRVWIGGVRLHHGATGAGVALAGALLRRRHITAAGLALMAHDRADIKFWFRLDKHTAT